MERYSILITGTWRSGKSTFLQHVGDFPYGSGADNLFSMLRIPIDDDLDLLMIRTGTRRRFDFMSDYLPPIIGTIILIDSSRPQTFTEARMVLQAHLAYHVGSLVVACNKQDLPEAWSPDDMRIVLRLPSWLPVVPCVATDHESVRQVLLTLLEQALVDIESETGELEQQLEPV